MNLLRYSLIIRVQLVLHGRIMDKTQFHKLMEAVCKAKKSLRRNVL
nr:MAG TPA: hypothetical protein [Bacteriophage sp.]